MALILIIEDEESLITLLKYNLEKAGHSVRTVSDGAQALTAVLNTKPNLILLDWMLPNQSGLDICKAIRKTPSIQSTPIIMLTAKGDEANKVQALLFGTDDYVTKPFSVPELMARITALLRRVPATSIGKSLSINGVRLNPVTHEVFRDNVQVHLGPTEFRLLQLLMEKPDVVISRLELLNFIWTTTRVSERTVDAYIKRLRKALDLPNKKTVIRTVRSAGYAFVSRG